MNCHFVEHEPRDHRGRCRMRCERCRYVTRTRTKLRPDQCDRPCSALPYWHEWGHWAAIALEAFWLPKTRWAWLIWRLGLVEVPDTGCGGCAARERWLNTLGGKLATSSKWWAKVLARVLVRRRLQ